MLRILFVSVILTFALVTFMPDVLPGFLDEASDSAPARAVRELGEGTVPAFASRLEAGASCAELISIRDTFDPQSMEVARMNDELGAIGCDAIASERLR